MNGTKSTRASGSHHAALEFLYTLVSPLAPSRRCVQGERLCPRGKVEPCPAEEPQPVTSPSRKNKTRSVTPGSWPSWNKSVLTYLPGEDSYSAMNSAPEVTTKSSSATGAFATNAVPCAFLHDSQWQ